MSSHSLLQGIFLTPGLNPCLLHCRQIHSCLSYQLIVISEVFFFFFKGRRERQEVQRERGWKEERASSRVEWRQHTTKKRGKKKHTVELEWPYSSEWTISVYLRSGYEADFRLRYLNIIFKCSVLQNYKGITTR